MLGKPETRMAAGDDRVLYAPPERFGEKVMSGERGENCKQEYRAKNEKPKSVTRGGQARDHSQQGPADNGGKGEVFGKCARSSTKKPSVMYGTSRVKRVISHLKSLKRSRRKYFLRWGYAYAYHYMQGEMPTVTLVHLLKLKKPRVEITMLKRERRQLLFFLRTAQAVARGIEEEIFAPNPGFLCGSCEYGKACMEWPLA